MLGYEQLTLHRIEAGQSEDSKEWMWGQELMEQRLRSKTRAALSLRSRNNKGGWACSQHGVSRERATGSRPQSAGTEELAAQTGPGAGHVGQDRAYAWHVCQALATLQAQHELPPLGGAIWLP